MRIFDFLKHKSKLYDIVVYDHQGTLKAGVIVAIHEQFDNDLYELDTRAVILEDNILKKLGNLKKIKKD